MRHGRSMVCAGVVLFGTVAFAQSVTYDFDSTADFSRLKRYAWVPGTNLSDELNHKRVVSALDAQLAAKGLSRVEAATEADVLVAYHASFDRDLQLSGFSSGWGGYRFGPARSGSARMEAILVGTLAVDIVDAASKTIVWRGIATKDIDVTASPEKRDKNIKRAVEKLFKNYPPTK
jgi:hypothetical protein